LSAVRSLSIVPGKGTRPDWPVDYRNLGAEELGSIYESLLEFVPRHDPASATFSLEQLSGNERKTSGTYYTPTSLIDVLLDSALDPVLDEAQQADDPRAALFAVTVCDPACGSGHFLVAAARRIAKRIAAIDTGDPEPGPEATRSILREVVGRCIYGVDVNPMAAELAKISLWLETVEAGRPLTFLDAHIKIGNSLLGATPALIAGGIPDAAFKPIEGDDKKVAAALAKRNKLERDQAERATDEIDLLLVQSAQDLRRLREAMAALPPAGDSLADQHVAARRYRELQSSPELHHARELADAWCASFVWRETTDAPAPVTDRVFRTLISDPAHVSPATRAEIGRLAAVHRFFHWDLEFPEVYASRNTGTSNPGTGWTGGFSCVLGNPPWEHTELKEQEFFAVLDPAIALAAGSVRKRLIAELPDTNPGMADAYRDAKRAADSISHFSRAAGRYPLCGRGRINTYALFAETSRSLVAPRGYLGLILPTGIATDATTQYFFRDLVESASLKALYDFENAKPLFEGVHRSFKFCLLALTGPSLREGAADFAFFVHDPADLAKPDVRFALKPDEITLLNPNTGTSPIFRSRRDAEITLGIYRRLPILLREGDPDGNPWGLSFMQGLFNMTSDSHLFRTRVQLEDDGWRLAGNVFSRGKEQFLPLYEAKMIHHFDHRWATYGPDGVRDMTSMEKTNPHSVALPRYWVSAADVDSRLEGRSERGWLLGWRDITNGTNERTAINSVFPRAAVNHKLPLILVQNRAEVILASLTSLISDYVVRQKIGGTSLTYFYLKQLALPDASIYERAAPWNPTARLDDWIVDRVDELVYTAWDLQPFALDVGDDGAPFVWDDERRALLRAELDAAYFHLYGLERDEVEHVLSTFPIVRRKDEAKYGEYRTARLILEIYDAMATSTGIPYQTMLDPPPGEGLRHAEAHQAVA
jgi:hypothetical protein